MVEFEPEDYKFDDESGGDQSSSDESETESIPIENNKKRHNDDDEILPTANKKSKNELYKQPTAEELNKLRETENLFNSNIFRLQINELLNEIKIKPKYDTQFDTWFKEFGKQLLQIPEFDDININDLKISKKKKINEQQKFINYAATIEKAPCSYDISMKFMKPKSVTLHGALKNVPNEKTKFTGNVLITMDKSMFFEKDYLNNKYVVKKQFYMAYIENFIKDFDNIKEINVKSYLNNDYVKYLEIVPTFSDQVLINIFVAPEIDTFKPNRFLPNRNNVKQLELDDFPELNLEDFGNEGTFYYNSAMLFDCTLEQNQTFLNFILNSYGNIKDAIRLIIIWLRQRQLNNDYRECTDDLVVYMIGFLFTKKKINKLMSSYQVVRIFWSFVANLNVDEKLSIAVDVKPNDLKLFDSDFVLLDTTGCYNVAAFLDRNIYLKIKAEAKTAMESLDSNRFNAFVHLFTTKMPIGLQYDAILKINDINNFKKVYWNCSEEDKFKYFGFYKLLIHNYIEKLLKYGLTNRIRELIPIFSSDSTITFGINLNQDNCYNVIEKGPKQYEAGAEEFKQFWGNLADLRRFKDSSIYEAVFFEQVKTIQDKRLIFVKIIEYVMQEKLELNYELNGGEMEKLLKLDHIVNPFPSGSNEEAILQIKSAQNDLDKILRNLKLPLPITAVQCTSDVYSYTDIFPPVATNHTWKRLNCTERGDFVIINEMKQYFKLPHLVEPIECVLQLALNSKWPKSLDALRAMKTIYYFEMSKLIRTEHNVLTSVRDDFIDVFYRGYVFRLRLYHPKEIVLLKRDVTADGLTCYKDTDESLELERNLEILPKISGALNGLHQEFASYGLSTCLIKRWLRSQLLDAGHISDIVISLLNASLFITSEPFRPAILPQVAFLRFLKFLSEFDHNFQTVNVNFNASMSVEELNDIDSQFLQNRHNYNALHINTPYDEGKSLFTKRGPSAVVMKRIKCLATETYKGLLHSLHEEHELTYKPYFIPNLSGYDLLIHLNASANLRRYQQVNREQDLILTLEPFDDTKSRSIPVVGFDPIELYLKELRENYGDYALFFHDYYGGNVIGVLWKQSELQEQDFKIAAVHGRKLSAKGKLELHTDALVEDFYIHGKGIVRTIEVQQK